MSPCHGIRVVQIFVGCSTIFCGSFGLTIIIEYYSMEKLKWSPSWWARLAAIWSSDLSFLSFIWTTPSQPRLSKDCRKVVWCLPYKKIILGSGLASLLTGPWFLWESVSYWILSCGMGFAGIVIPEFISSILFCLFQKNIKLFFIIANLCTLVLLAVLLTTFSHQMCKRRSFLLIPFIFRAGVHCQVGISRSYLSPTSQFKVISWYKLNWIKVRMPAHPWRWNLKEYNDILILGHHPSFKSRDWSISYFHIYTPPEGAVNGISGLIFRLSSKASESGLLFLKNFYFLFFTAIETFVVSGMCLMSPTDDGCRPCISRLATCQQFSICLVALEFSMVPPKIIKKW